MIRIGEIIKAKRKEQELTQEELAGILGVSKAAISKWENGECYPDITTLPKIADIFYISIDELLDYKPKEKPQEIINRYSFNFSLSNIDIEILDHGQIVSSTLEKRKYMDGDTTKERWEVLIQMHSTEVDFPKTIQKYVKPNVLIEGFSERLVNGKNIMDDRLNKHYVCKDKIWEWRTPGIQYVKQMIKEQIDMGLIEDDEDED